MFKVEIPKISDEELERRYAQIKPIIGDDRGNKFWLREFKFDELRKVAYTWDKNWAKEPVGVHELQPILNEDFACIIKYGYYGLFKPSIAEVLAQIDTPFIELVRAFEIIDYPKTAADFYRTLLHRAVFDAHYHVTIVRLYASATDYNVYKTEADGTDKFI